MINYAIFAILLYDYYWRSFNVLCSSFSLVSSSSLFCNDCLFSRYWFIYSSSSCSFKYCSIYSSFSPSLIYTDLFWMEVLMAISASSGSYYLEVFILWSFVFILSKLIPQSINSGFDGSTTEVLTDLLAKVTRRYSSTSIAFYSGFFDNDSWFSKYSYSWSSSFSVYGLFSF